MRAYPADIGAILAETGSAMLSLDGLDDIEAALCRANLLHFARRALLPFGLQPAAHHQLLLRELQRVADTPGARLMVMMPPGSAKSTYGSMIFPAWWLAHGRVSIIGAAHTAELAQAFSGRVQATAADNADVLGYGLPSTAKDRWSTTLGGQYRAAGIGGAVTGFRADLIMIDDPVKSRADADSETYRDAAWNWYGADLMTRLKPGGRVVLIMTRWHEDDLAGRILATQGDRWRVLRLPAYADGPDPLGRPLGAPLWGDDGYGFAADLEAKREEFLGGGKKRDWAALFQQSPRADDGNLFRIDLLGVADALPPVARWVRRWDLAATDDGGDWTCGAKIGRTEEGRFVVADVVRFRGGPEDVERVIVATAQRDGRSVRIALPQDPGQAGKAQVLYLTRKLAGFTTESAVETGDKATRAAPFAAQVNVGNVMMLRADWNPAFVEELRSFPSGLHDDQVDASAGGFNVLTAAPRPARQQKLGY